MSAERTRRDQRVRVELHAHTTFSDGLLTPEELIAEAAAANLVALAITDHDTVSGIDAAIRAASEREPRVTIIPGIELSCVAGEVEFHLLGYFLDQDDQALHERLAVLGADRERRLDGIVERLASLNITLDTARVRELAGEGTVGRPHVARAMVEAGVVDSVRTAFDLYLANGQPAYVARRSLSPEEGVALIHAAGGAAVLAHPFSIRDPRSAVRRLLAVGLDGLEVDYGDYGPDFRLELRSIAEEFGLIQAGGSDFHGPDTRPGRGLGMSGVSPDVVGQLRAAAPEPRHAKR